MERGRFATWSRPAPAKIGVERCTQAYEVKVPNRAAGRLKWAPGHRDRVVAFAVFHITYNRSIHHTRNRATIAPAT